MDDVSGNGARQMLLAGLPFTGKTSYLAVFYLALDNEPGRLRLGGYRDDREYVNEIAGRLMRCEKPHHTETNEHRELSLSLELASSGAPVVLRIPDLSGETWEQAVTERWWPEGVDHQVRDSQAVLFFIHPGRIDAGATKGDADAVAAAIGAPRISDPPRTKQDPKKKKVRVRGQSPTQVLMVDMLQLTLEQRGARPARACIIVSAWDQQRGMGVTPNEYVAKNLPLLDQYRASNCDWLSMRVYGVSAQGGDFDAGREELAERDPLERAYACAGDGAEASIEDPIAWSLGLDDE